MERSVYLNTADATLYASPYLVATRHGYTKHYYAESERVASRIGGGGLHDLDEIGDEKMFLDHRNRANMLFQRVQECMEAAMETEESPLRHLYDWRDINEDETRCYWYHTDHLGSSSWITYTDGSAVEHLHYLPWGEDLVRQRHTNYHARYTFSGKEKDAETGYSFFGSRYYSSDLSIWLSVDPMAAKYPSLSPYVYCANNPVKLVDPNGEDIIEVDQKTGRTTITEQKGNDILRCGNKSVELSGNGVYRKALEAGKNEGNNGGTLLMGMSKSDAKKTFNFMADNTNVEWGYMETRNDDGTSSFMVGSAHSNETESLVFGKAMAAKEGSVVRYDHNHLRTDMESTSGWPSTPSTKAKDSYVDTKAWSDLMQRNPEITLGIRHRNNTIKYIEKGKVSSDYPFLRKYF